MSPYEQAMARIAQLEAENKNLRHQIATEHAGVLAGVKLERDQAVQRLDMKTRMCNDLQRERMELVGELRTLQDDKMLLDWFDNNNHYVEVDFPPGANLKTSSWAFYCPKGPQYDSVRNRLRIAMTEYSKPANGIFDNE